MNIRVSAIQWQPEPSRDCLCKAITHDNHDKDNINSCEGKDYAIYG